MVVVTNDRRRPPPIGMKKVLCSRCIEHEAFIAESDTEPWFCGECKEELEARPPTRTFSQLAVVTNVTRLLEPSRMNVTEALADYRKELKSQALARREANKGQTFAPDPVVRVIQEGGRE